MSFELYDAFQNYTRRGSLHQLFNIARSDDALEELMYFAFVNDSGAHIIMRITTSGSLSVKLYKFYGAGCGSLDTDWTNRASLTYSDFNQLFSEGA